MQDRWGTLFSIDDMVAEIAGAVDKLGSISDNTYIMFTSDHGYHLGQFRIPDEKMMPYETDIRVPFFARGPGIAPGTRISQMISNIDIGPTLCDLAGVKVPNLMDGRSLVPLLKAGAGNLMVDVDGLLDRPWRTHFMTEFAEGGNQEWGTNVSVTQIVNAAATAIIISGGIRVLVAMPLRCACCGNQMP
jgi:arylsulfatase A-like enzyme